MVAPVPPGAPRPNNQQYPGPPNFYPGSQGHSNPLADNMQNLSLNRPPPMMPGSGPRPPPPFGQSPQSFPQQSPAYGVPQRGPSPMSRPGPPAGLARPGGPPPVSQTAGFQSNVPLNRPTGPPSSQPPFGSRPSMTGGPVAQPVASSSGFPAFGPSGNVAAGPPPGAPPIAFGSPPPVGSGMSMPPSGMLGGPVSNGHQMAGSGGFPRGSQFPGGAVTTPQTPYAQPPSRPFPRACLPYGPPSAQVAPPPLGFPGPMQPPRYGMGTLPNQSMTNIPTAMDQPGAAAPGGPARIDPNQIPRPGSSSSPTVFETRQSNQANPPPPATSDYVVRDTGNCSPRYMRCTINQIPCTVDLLSTSGMQLALMVQPLAQSHPSEEPIQVVDFGEGGPVRCSRFMQAT
ncbi:PREDICTED: protein transport protein Sec24-like At4g32640 [Camelina sativa]|uniref:Protein transport protein Sec24-like At4g32640 n=1 Tax=Camelina sativa TaxID=90675 RepID=A0ABM0U5U2_CAMSA|nr:PREDICTED: protein transport protein Sec24-like At4g32640 [Camelina sativa]